MNEDSYTLRLYTHKPSPPFTPHAKLPAYSNKQIMLILFHKEECPFCVKVRQFMSDNSISYVSIVSPKGAPSRVILEQMGGKQQVPYLVDADHGESMYESDDIIAYLQAHYLEI